MLERTLKFGENNSALLMGVRAGGKSLCVRHVMRALRDAYVPRGLGFVEVYLNGLVHADDVTGARASRWCALATHSHWQLFARRSLPLLSDSAARDFASVATAK